VELPVTPARFPQTFPKIETERLILREITYDDTTSIFRNFSNPEVAKWFFERPHTDIEETKKFVDQFIADFEQGKGLTWAITLKENSQCIGTCGYGEVEVGNRGEIGFDLAEEYWGKGLMSESLIAILNYGFSALKLKKVEAHTYSHNVRARHLLEKLGFELENIVEDNAIYFLNKVQRIMVEWF
jgi:ribosomal-protein-alanine N-acetyltransferase